MRRNVVEFRYKSWWREEVYKAFKSMESFFVPAVARA
jgi:hypothetical protein